MKSGLKTLRIKHDDLVDQILVILHLSKIQAWASHKVGAYKHKPLIKGISDIIGILPRNLFYAEAPWMEDGIHPLKRVVGGPSPLGQFLAIEVKIPPDTATGDQAEFLGKVNAAGGIGFVAQSIDDVVKRLDLKNVHLQ